MGGETIAYLTRMASLTATRACRTRQDNDEESVCLNGLPRGPRRHRDRCQGGAGGARGRREGTGGGGEREGWRRAKGRAGVSRGDREGMERRRNGRKERGRRKGEVAARRVGEKTDLSHTLALPLSLSSHPFPRPYPSPSLLPTPQPANPSSPSSP